MENTYSISGNIVDVVNRKIFQGTITVKNGKISSITKEKTNNTNYIVPGLIDAHIHIESSMLIPSEFARMAVVHGTVATVSDPHEIANVLGIDGVKYIIENGKKVPLKFYFGASSCVPATIFETAGANLGVDKIEELLKTDEIKYLSEMMNWPGVLSHDKEVMAKIAVAKKYNKPVDGHAPGLRGEEAKKYIEAGISTDHECFTIEEALDKIKYGMKIIIREGSAAKNFEALIGLMGKYPEKLMFCSDDRHPNDLEKCHINDLVKRAIKKGYDPVTVLRSCVYNPVKHYGLEVGLLQEGDPADFIIIDNFDNFNVLATYIDGTKVAENGKTLIDPITDSTPNNFRTKQIKLQDLQITPQSDTVKVIHAIDGQLITNKISAKINIEKNNAESNTKNDVLKLVVTNRYEQAKPAIAFINNFGIKNGAIASSVAHDSHNIIAVGVEDEDIMNAVNLLIKEKGGVSLANADEKIVLPLHVAGLMSNKDCYLIASEYDSIDKKAKKLGSKLNAPYMTLSFMALLVIPELKLSDKGLFDGNRFEFTPLFE
ncbi:MAG: adenine deaminase [Bacteroidetes bacterium]|jgi:adenine deaminase|nr:adenine deaminase [Bacteroidota bacterium]